MIRHGREECEPKQGLWTGIVRFPWSLGLRRTAVAVVLASVLPLASAHAPALPSERNASGRERQPVPLARTEARAPVPESPYVDR